MSYFDSDKWHGKADAGGSSLELRDFDSDNSVAGAWAASDETARSSWQTYSYEGIATDDGIGLDTWNELQMGLLDEGEFLIDDVSIIEENSTEFIQNGDFESDVIGAIPDKWRAIGTHGSHGNTVVVNDPENPSNKCLHVVATGATENKHNKIETTFTNSEEVVLGNTYRISFRVKYLSGSNQLNSRLFFNYLQRTTILNTPTTWGTPGVANSTSVTNAGPTLSGLSHSPVVPNTNQTVTVGINASDNDGVSSATLNYSVNGGSYQTVTMNLNTTNGRYEGAVPSQAASSLIQFYVAASDGTSTSFYPAAADEAGTFYKVQDGLADTTGLRHNFRILMSESDYDFMLERTNLLSDDRLPATVIENEETVYYNVGVRLKGSPVGRDGGGNHEYSIRFSADQPFRGVHNSIAVERGSISQQLFSKHLNNRSGTPYSSAYDDVAYIIPPDENDDGMGLLFMTRHTNSFFDSIHPDDADEDTLFNQELLYSPLQTEDGDPESLKLPRQASNVLGRYDLKSYGPDKETIRWGFEIRSARDRDDYSRLIDLNEVFELEGEAFENALEQVADVDQWMRIFALMTLNGTDDVFSRIWEHNFRFYVRPDGKIAVMQWDLDRAFGLSTTDPSTILPTVNNNGDTWSVTKLFTSPRFARLFHGHIDDLINTTFNDTYLTDWAAELQSVSGFPMNSHLNYVTNRAALVDDIIPSQIPFQITTNGGNDFVVSDVSDSSTELLGDGWVDVFSIAINGAETEVTWTDEDSWMIIAPLSSGVNALTITAYNYHGVEVGNDSITITNSNSILLADASNTSITEFHYHPSDPTTAEEDAGFTDKDQFEFFEITNVHPTESIDMTGVIFSDGVEYSFPVSTIILAGESVIVASDSAAFQLRYGVEALGQFSSGSISNGGETIRLDAADSSVIVEFTYDDSFPWPESADGDGYSLVLVSSDPTSPADWRPSNIEHGTPGTSDSIPYQGGDLLSYALSEGPSFTGAGADAVFTFSQVLGTDSAIVIPEFSSDLTTWIPGDSSTLINSSNEGDGTFEFNYKIPTVLENSAKVFARITVSLRE